MTNRSCQCVAYKNGNSHLYAFWVIFPWWLKLHCPLFWKPLGIFYESIQFCRRDRDNVSCIKIMGALVFIPWSHLTPPHPPTLPPPPKKKKEKKIPMWIWYCRSSLLMISFRYNMSRISLLSILAKLLQKHVFVLIVELPRCFYGTFWSADPPIIV